MLKHIEKKSFQKIPKRLEKIQILQSDFFVFKVQNDFYSFSSRFQYENEKILYSPKFCIQNLIVFKVQNNFNSFSSRFPAVFQPFSSCFQYENNFFLFSPKFGCQNLIVFKCFNTIFSIYQPFSV